MLWRVYEHLRYCTIVAFTAPLLAIAWIVLKFMDTHRRHIISVKYHGDAKAYERAKWRDEF